MVFYLIYTMQISKLACCFKYTLSNTQLQTDIHVNRRIVMIYFMVMILVNLMIKGIPEIFPKAEKYLLLFCLSRYLKQIAD